MSKALVQLIQSQFPQAVLETHSQYGDDTAVLDAKAWKAVARYLRGELSLARESVRKIETQALSRLQEELGVSIAA